MERVGGNRKKRRRTLSSHSLYLFFSLWFPLVLFFGGGDQTSLSFGVLVFLSNLFFAWKVGLLYARWDLKEGNPDGGWLSCMKGSDKKVEKKSVVLSFFLINSKMQIAPLSASSGLIRISFLTQPMFLNLKGPWSHPELSVMIGNYSPKTRIYRDQGFFSIQAVLPPLDLALDMVLPESARMPSEVSIPVFVQESLTGQVYQTQFVYRMEPSPVAS